ncbi:MAG: FAD-dependent oxidoreductase [Firmicutes bacterium]|nr:FAD-dependent oxidoreductase [Bacillota bacterium]
MKQTDIIIIGAGPSGMMSAIYAKRANKEVILLDKASPGGSLHSTFQVDNYLGFGKVSAEELIQKMVDHLRDLEIEDTKGFVNQITKEKDYFIVATEKETYFAKAVIVASGTSPKPLKVPNEFELLSKGISYCAVCDGLFFENEDVVVIGGGDSALEESIYLSHICKSVTIIHELKEFTASKGLIKRIQEHDKISVKLSTKVIEFIGNEELDAITLLDCFNNITYDFKAKGAFIYIGNQADTTYINNLLITDESGFIPVNQFMETKVKGLFACGDVTKKDFRYIVTAISDGAIAALSAVKYLDDSRNLE